MQASRLSDEDVRARLSDVVGWEVADGILKKSFEFADFVQSMQFVNRLAEAAEAAHHHPDIDIRYDKVHIALVTHDSGGITEKDFALAQEADAVAER
ncbi:MAG TPA: 4a-hydroxytetrahydrobiopterin dehydratase [Armatimonadaceae bacterium]|nr:4a-hydroxytetrahydrobiopterin dehydratase [Armatimonadaceae bacterium]